MRYSEDQAAEILRLAMQSDARVDKADGLDIDEIVRVARELGIDEDRVRSAASLVEQRGPDAVGTFWSPPKKIVLEGVFEGMLTEEDWPDVVTTLRRELGETGETEELGSAFEWHSTDAEAANGTKHTVTVAPKQGRTRLTAVVNRTALHSVSWGLGYAMPLSFASLLTIAAIAESALPAPIALLAWLLLAVGGPLLIRKLLFNGYYKKRDAMTRIMRRVSDTVQRFTEPKEDVVRTESDDVPERLQLGDGT